LTILTGNLRQPLRSKDFQDEKIKGSGEKSGKGLLRVLKFYPEKNEIVISTLSELT